MSIVMYYGYFMKLMNYRCESSARILVEPLEIPPLLAESVPVPLVLFFLQLFGKKNIVQ